VDVKCYDRFVNDAAKWRILRRNVVYEQDRTDPVRHGVAIRLDDELLQRFPKAIATSRMSRKSGLRVDPDLPTSA
jgi:hypothetical protein